MGIESQDIQTKFYQRLKKKAEQEFYSYVDHIAQNLVYLCLTAEEEGIPFQLMKYETFGDFLAEHEETVTEDLRIILQMSTSVKQFFNESTQSWLILHVKDTLAELIKTDWQELYRWVNEKTVIIEGDFKKGFHEDPILFTFEVLEHDEINEIVQHELSEQLLDEVIPLNFLFLYKKGKRLYRNRS